MESKLAKIWLRYFSYGLTKSIPIYRYLSSKFFSIYLNGDDLLKVLGFVTGHWSL